MARMGRLAKKNSFAKGQGRPQSGAWPGRSWNGPARFAKNDRAVNKYEIDLCKEKVSQPVNCHKTLLNIDFHATAKFF
jgi:hypothetical protein